MNWQEQNRRAKISINPDTLRQLIDLPDGLEIERIWMTQDPMSICIVVGGESLESQPHDVELPFMPGVWGIESKVVVRGSRPYFRWNWSRR